MRCRVRGGRWQRGREANPSVHGNIHRDSARLLAPSRFDVLVEQKGNAEADWPEP